MGRHRGTVGMFGCMTGMESSREARVVDMGITNKRVVECVNGLTNEFSSTTTATKSSDA